MGLKSKTNQKSTNKSSNQEDSIFNALSNHLNTTILFTVFVVFIISFIGILFGLSSIFNKSESKLRYIDEDGIRYIELVDGYIKEQLVVETGTILPELSSYFRDDYELPDDLAAQYFENNNSLSLEQFTYQKEGDYYLKGVRTIDVTLFGKYEYVTKLVVVDTIIPDVTLKEVTITTDDTLDMKLFVKTYSDNSNIDDFTVYFKEPVDFSKVGTYDIILLVCDLSNNCFEGTTKLTVEKGKNTTNPSGAIINPNSGAGSSSKPNSGSGNSTKPSSGSSGNSGSGSSSGTGGSSGSTPKPTSPNDTIKSFDASNVISPQERSCEIVEREVTNTSIDIDHYGTTESIPFGKVTYKIDSDCSITFINPVNRGIAKITYAKNRFNGTASTMLGEAISIYNTKNNPSSGYQTTLDNMVKWINQARTEAGVETLELDYYLTMVATMRAMELAYSGIDYSNHTRPNGSSWTTLWAEYGLTQPSKRGENLAVNYSSDKKAFDGLMNSQSHKDNILDKLYTKVGIAKVTFYNNTYIVQIFST